MELYYTIFALLWTSLLFEFASKKAKNVVLVFWAIFFTLFGGLRWNVGGDWEQYHDHFLFSQWSNIFNYDRYGNGVEKLEPGFVFINVLVKTFFGSFCWYNIFLCAFIQYTYVHVSKYYYKEHPLMMYVFIMLMAGQYFPVRAGFSVTICYWAYQTIKERRLKAYLILMFIAFEIHHASLIFLPAYWLGKINAKSIYLYGFWGMSLAVGVVFQDLFKTMAMALGGGLGEKALIYTGMQNEGFDDAGLSVGAVALPCFFLFVYLMVRSKVKDKFWINALINIFVIYKAIAFIFMDGMGDLARLSDYFIFGHAIMFMTTLRYLKLFGKKARLAGVAFFVLYMGFQVTKVCSGYWFKESNIPYKTIFDFNDTK